MTQVIKIRSTEIEREADQAERNAKRRTAYYQKRAERIFDWNRVNDQKNDEFAGTWLAFAMLIGYLFSAGLVIWAVLLLWSAILA